MENTEALITKFREKTLEILNCFNNEDFDKINELFMDREAIIQIFKENPKVYTREKIVKELNETDIMELDAKIKELTIKNIKVVNEKLEKINKDRLVRKKYYNGFSGNSLFFNKKIY